MIATTPNPLLIGRKAALSTGALESIKWLALLAMVVDHIAVVFYGRDVAPWVEAVGRLAFPLFAMVLGYNLARPRCDLLAVTGRLLGFGALAMLPHGFLFGWGTLNVMFAFAVATMVIWSLREGRGMLALLLFLSGGAVVEYWWPGLVLVTCVYGGTRHGWTFWRVLVLSVAFAALCGLNGNLWALLAFPVVALAGYVAPAVPRLRWAFWLAYPAHLFVLAFVVLVTRAASG